MNFASRRNITLVAAAACLAAPATAAARHPTFYSQFDVTVQGRMVESWSKNVDHQFGCSPRTESSGAATIAFATRRKYRVTADPYTGFHGRPLVDVNVDRSGRSREANLDGSGNTDCGDSQPNRDGSACGHRAFRSRIALPKTSKFGISLAGDKHEYTFDCPYPEPTPTLAESFYESTSAIGLSPSKVDWQLELFGGCDGHGHCRKPKRAVTIHNVRHLTSPYGKPEFQGTVTGGYTADIDWTVRIARVGRLHSGR